MTALQDYARKHPDKFTTNELYKLLGKELFRVWVKDLDNRLYAHLDEVSKATRNNIKAGISKVTPDIN